MRLAKQRTPTYVPACQQREGCCGLALPGPGSGKVTMLLLASSSSKSPSCPLFPLLADITPVMFCASLVPGVWNREYEDKLRGLAASSAGSEP